MKSPTNGVTRTKILVTASIMALFHSSAFAVVTDEQFEGLKERFTQMKTEFGVLKQASYELPIGSIVAWAGDTDRPIPNGFLLCRGQRVKKAEYPELEIKLAGVFNKAGAGAPPADEFDLPDFRGRTLVGAGQGEGLTKQKFGNMFGEEKHTLSVSEMPSHTHADKGHTHTVENQWTGRADYGNSWGGQHAARDITTSTGYANLENTGEGVAHNNMQPSIAINYIIKAKHL